MSMWHFILNFNRGVCSLYIQKKKENWLIRFACVMIGLVKNALFLEIYCLVPWTCHWTLKINIQSRIEIILRKFGFPNIVNRISLFGVQCMVWWIFGFPICLPKRFASAPRDKHRSLYWNSHSSVWHSLVQCSAVHGGDVHYDAVQYFTVLSGVVQGFEDLCSVVQ